LDATGVWNEDKSSSGSGREVLDEHKSNLLRKRQGSVKRAQIPLNHRLENRLKQEETTGNKDISSPHPTYQIPRQQIDANMAG